MTSHILVIGETQSGKTHLCNRLHREGPPSLLSIFFNTNNVAYIWGTYVSSLAQFKAAVAAGDRRINYVPPSDKAGARSHLQVLVDYLKAKGRDGAIWARLLIDEAHRFEGTDEGPVEDGARTLLGKGVQVVIITQYSPGIKPGTRTNCPWRIIFRPGSEGEALLVNNYGVPREAVAHANQKRHWASYTPARGWRCHPPVG